MNNISRRHHELKIAYLRHKLRSLPHGYFGTWKNRQVVYIYYEPGNEKVGHSSKRRFFISSKRGRESAEQIREYKELKSQLDVLLSEWKARYTEPPRQIDFPLRKRRRGYFTYDFFKNAVPDQNPRKKVHNVTDGKTQFRSKNELVAAMIMEKFGYETKTEVQIEFDEFTGFYADVLFYVPEIDKVILLEIDGALEKADYVSKSYHNTAACVINGLVEMKDFIVVRYGNGYDIDSRQIERMISAAIDASIDDLVL